MKSQRGEDSIKIINKSISPYFWCGFFNYFHVTIEEDHSLAEKKWLVEVNELTVPLCNICSSVRTVSSVILAALFTFSPVCACMWKCDTYLLITCGRSQRKRHTLPKRLIITFCVDFDSFNSSRFIPHKLPLQSED